MSDFVHAQVVTTVHVVVKWRLTCWLIKVKFNWNSNEIQIQKVSSGWKFCTNGGLISKDFGSVLKMYQANHYPEHLLFSL